MKLGQRHAVVADEQVSYISAHCGHTSPKFMI